jgi:predicted AAA+ superfamily ATPase
MYKRALFHTISAQLQHKNAIVITGMRQVGKTTLMKQLAKAWNEKYVWFDFDNPLDQLLFENSDFRGIFTDLKRIAGARKESAFWSALMKFRIFLKAQKQSNISLIIII